MKKILALVMAVLIITALFASCGGSRTSAPSASAAPPGSGSFGQDGGSNAESQLMGDEQYDLAKPKSDQEIAYSTASTATDTGNALTPGSYTASLSGDKIIYNCSTSIETTKFDETIKNVDMLLSKYGAFVETSYVSGNSLGFSSFRTADYTIRVPVSNFKSITSSLPILGNVLNTNTTSQNITAQFTDTQSRLDALTIEEDRLLSMLEKAATVEDMITIESRLSDIRYQIESLTSTLRNWQNQVDYSTVSIHISEVAELTERVSVQRTYWEQLGDGVSATLKGIGIFFKGLFMGIVVALPVLILLAVIAVIVLVILRAANKKKNAGSQNVNIDKK